MREIKFRAWMDEAHYMVAFGLFDKPENVFPSDPIMQYTGLKDKNGKEDYDGNIWEVEYRGQKHRFLREVITTWKGYEFSFRCLTGEVSPVHANVDEDGIIIGNLYENPELLKKKEV